MDFDRGGCGEGRRSCARFPAMRAPTRPVILLVFLASLAMGCDDRKIEPYVPGEEPRQPDLSKIFPAPEEEPSIEAAPVVGQGTRGNIPPSRAGLEASEEAQSIEGIVRVEDGIEARAGGVLFIIARRADGQGPPVAVKRIEGPRFPLEFSLGPADRMIAEMPFEGPFAISVRLDGDGNASSREPGDVLGAYPEEINPGATGIELVLDTPL